MSDIKKKLDKLQREEKLKTLTTVVVPTIVVLLAFIIIPILDTPDEEVEIIGTVTGLHQRQREDGPPPRLLVEINKGKTVIARGSEGHAFHKGKKVILIKQTTKLLGRKKYIFRRYLDE